MKHRVPSTVIELGVDTDLFLLHLYAALAEKERQIISEPTKAAIYRLRPINAQNDSVESLRACLICLLAKLLRN
jgi:hypothetical protein